jgi:hypothetical protein
MTLAVYLELKAERQLIPTPSCSANPSSLGSTSPGLSLPDEIISLSCLATCPEPDSSERPLILILNLTGTPLSLFLANLLTSVEILCML